MDHDIAAACHVGKVRSTNEDVTLVERLGHGWSLLAVADGMGGLSHGELASATGIQAVRSEISAADLTEKTARGHLAHAFKSAHDAVWRCSDGERMGTTLVAAIATGSNVYLASVGDSRAYVVRDGSIRQVTEDHSLAAERFRAGLMTKQEAADSSYRHVLLRAIGLTEDPPEVDSFDLSGMQGSRLLLCSDGLYSTVADNELAAIVSSETPRQAVAHLVNLANDRGGKDNISVVIASFNGCQ